MMSVSAIVKNRHNVEMDGVEDWLMLPGCLVLHSVGQSN